MVQELTKTYLSLEFKNLGKVIEFIDLCSSRNISVRYCNETECKVAIDFMDFLCYSCLDNDFLRFRNNNILLLEEIKGDGTIVESPTKLNDDKDMVDRSYLYEIDLIRGIIRKDYDYQKTLTLPIINVYMDLLIIFQFVNGDPINYKEVVKRMFRRGYFTDPRSEFYIETNEIFKKSIKFLDIPKDSEATIKRLINEYYDSI